MEVHFAHLTSEDHTIPVGKPWELDYVLFTVFTECSMSRSGLSGSYFWHELQYVDGFWEPDLQGKRSYSSFDTEAECVADMKAKVPQLMKKWGPPIHKSAHHMLFDVSS